MINLICSTITFFNQFGKTARLFLKLSVKVRDSQGNKETRREESTGWYEMFRDSVGSE